MNSNLLGCALNAHRSYICRSCILTSRRVLLRHGHGGRHVPTVDESVGERIDKQLDMLEAIESAEIRDSLGLQDPPSTPTSNSGRILKKKRKPRAKEWKATKEAKHEDIERRETHEYTRPRETLQAALKAAKNGPHEMSSATRDLLAVARLVQRGPQPKPHEVGPAARIIRRRDRKIEPLSRGRTPRDQPQNATTVPMRLGSSSRYARLRSSRTGETQDTLRVRRVLSEAVPRRWARARKVLSQKIHSELPKTGYGRRHSQEVSIKILRRSKPPGKTLASVLADKEPKASDEPATKHVRKARTKKLHNAIETISVNGLEIKPIDTEQPPVPRLAYGLDRVLFNRGVYQLQDTRSRVFNFDPYLQTIMPVSEFDFTALNDYITSSRDQSLENLAKSEGKRYIGSTSSMTGMLSQFHYLLSQWREVNTGMLSATFPAKLKSFTLLQRGPTAIILKWQNGTYAIDADKEFATANVLSMLGKSMEKLLTLNTGDYEKYRKSNPEQVSKEEQTQSESYHYSTLGDFLFRSQLDAYDPRLPGTGMFDLKTRAVLSVRMKVSGYEEMKGYEIRDRTGEYESFEREYYDMIRSAFLKYSLQVRMGRMDGIFVAYHNTDRIFGFQYVSLEEMDLAIHGTSDITLGDQEFKLSLDLLNKVLDRATKDFPEESLRLHFETREANKPFMYIFAEPVTDSEILTLQSRNDEKIKNFEREILGLHQTDEPVLQKDESIWDDINAKVQESIENDEAGEDEFSEAMKASTHGDSPEKGIEESGTLEDGNSLPLDSISTSLELNGNVEDYPEESESKESIIAFDNDDFLTKELLRNDENYVLEDVQSIASNHGTRTLRQAMLSPPSQDPPAKDDSESNEKQWNGTVESGKRLLAMTLTIQNKVGNEYVTRPDNLSKGDETEFWKVEYSLADIPDKSRSWKLYEACQRRRKKTLDPEEVENSYQMSFLRNLQRLSRKGQSWRKKKMQEEAGMETIVLGRDHSPRDSR